MSDAETTAADRGALRTSRIRTDQNETTDQSLTQQLDENDITEAQPEAAECTSCPECSGRLFEDAEHGETVCRDCGLVVDEDAIDHGPEWRAYDQQERNQKKRTGSPSTERLHDKGLSTTIGWQDKDANGNVLNARQRRKMSRLRTWDERYRTKDSAERNIKAGITEIERMGSALGISDSARETASVIYKRAHEEGLLLGRSIESIATGSLYAAARMAGLPRTLADVVHVSRIERLPFERAYRCILQELELAIEPNDPIEFLPQFVDELDVARPDEFEQTARELLEEAMEEDPMSGKSPSGLAASALYAASLMLDERVRQDDLSEISDTSNVTIRNGYQRLLDLTAESPP